MGRQVWGEGIQAFLDLAGDTEPLTREEEQECSEIVMNSNVPEKVQWARDKLVVHSIRFAIKEALRLPCYGHDREDMVQDAILGLHRAAELYDHRRGIRFVHYAGWQIRASVQRGIELAAKPVSLPQNTTSRIAKSYGLLEASEKDRHAIAPFQNLLDDDDNGINKFVLIAQKALTNNHKSLDAPLNAYKNASCSGRNRVDFLKSSAPGPSWVASDESLRDAIRRLLDCLDLRQRMILELRYGLDSDEEPMTIAALAEEFGCSPQRIAQILHQAIDKITGMTDNDVLADLGSLIGIGAADVDELKADRRKTRRNRERNQRRYVSRFKARERKAEAMRCEE